MNELIYQLNQSLSTLRFCQQHKKCHQLLFRDDIDNLQVTKQCMSQCLAVGAGPYWVDFVHLGTGHDGLLAQPQNNQKHILAGQLFTFDKL